VTAADETRTEAFRKKKLLQQLVEKYAAEDFDMTALKL
jgi:hypothetical protein